MKTIEATFESESAAIPVSFVPTPTREYREHRKTLRVTVEPGAPVLPSPVPIPAALKAGPRVMIYKQDPSVQEIGIRKAYIPTPVLTGPKDARIEVQERPPFSLPPIPPNAMGDFIQVPGTPAFDAVHTFAVVRETLTMYQRALGTPVPWQWNTATNSDPLKVFPRAGETANAYYSRTDKSLLFFFFTPPGSPAGTPQVFTCRSLDIVAHETGHAVLDGLQPRWLAFGNPPQTGGLHESFGDLTAIFLALSQLDQVEAVIAQTKANLHDKTFLADLAEQFGLALGRPNGLRNADNDLKLSQVGTEVHAISQVFTGAIYDILADIFAFERNPGTNDDAAVLYGVGRYLSSLVLRAFKQAPATAATFADVANNMLQIAATDGKPVQYRNFIRNRFSVREVVASPTPLTVDFTELVTLKPHVVDHPGAVQDRKTCCGTMQHPEYTGGQETVEAEAEQLRKSLKEVAQVARK